MLVIRKSWTFATTEYSQNRASTRACHTQAKLSFWPLKWGFGILKVGKSTHISDLIPIGKSTRIGYLHVFLPKCASPVGPPGGPNNSASKAKKKKKGALSNRRREPTVDVVNYAALLSLISGTILESQESRPGGGGKVELPALCSSRPDATKVTQCGANYFCTFLAMD